jgi:hypothetical protein
MTERIFELTPEDLREAFVAALVEREGPGFSTRQATDQFPMNMLTNTLLSPGWRIHT